MTARATGSAGTGIASWAADTPYTAGQVLLHGSLLYVVDLDHVSPSTFSTANLTQIGLNSGVVSTTNAAFLPVSYRNGSFSTAKGQSNGTDTDENVRLAHPTVRAVTAPSLVFDNLQNTYPITVSAGFELPSGAIKRVTFNGANSVTIPAGTFVISDPVGAYVAAGATFYTRTRIVVASGDKWMTNTVPGTGETAEKGVGTTDKTVSGTISGSVDGVYGPLAVIAPSSTGKPFVMGYGDSLVQGTGDNGYPPLLGSNSLSAGFLHRACSTNNFPFLNGGQTAESVQTAGDIVAPNSQVTARRVFATYSGVCYCVHGINDIVGARTVAQIEQDMVNSWTANGAGGARVIQSTLTPYSTSTDNWVTTANQTAIANEAKRVAINDWIRAGAPLNPSTLAPVAIGTVGALLAGQIGHPLYGYDEVADSVESARNSGKWGGGVTDSGVHVAGNATITGVNGALWEVGMNALSSNLFAGAAVVSKTSTSITVNSGAAVSGSGTVPLTGAITADGLHPNGAGAVRMAAAINTGQWT